MEAVLISVPRCPTVRSVNRHSLFLIFRWALCFLALTSVLPRAFAKVHPMPLDKNADAATCLQCHNSDDNREFGGTGAAGPHGSANSHILERNYQFSQAALPGGTVTNLFPNPDLSMAGPYSMCAKCHDLNQIMANTSFTQHSFHVSQYGFTCSTCHTAHGMGATSPTITGERMVNFDANVVAPNGTAPISYSHGTNTCTLTCHNAAHNADGTVTAPTAAARTKFGVR